MPKAWKLQAVQSHKDRLWYVRLCGGNGEIVMRSKGYRSADEAQELCGQVQANEIDIRVGAQCGTSPGWYLEPHKSPKDDLWYNRLVRGDGAIAMWSEGYARIDAAQRACRKMRDAMVVTLEPRAAK